MSESPTPTTTVETTAETTATDADLATDVEIDEDVASPRAAGATPSAVILEHLADAEDGRLPQATLSTRLEWSSATVSRTVRSLEDAGLVEITHSLDRPEHNLICLPSSLPNYGDGVDVPEGDSTWRKYYMRNDE